MIDAVDRMRPWDPFDLSEFCCQNPACRVYQMKNKGNLRVDSYYGKSRYRLLYCRICGVRFSERKGSHLFGAQLDPARVTELLRCLQEGRGIRGTARLLGINRNTVMRYSRKLRGTESCCEGNP